MSSEPSLKGFVGFGPERLMEITSQVERISDQGTGLEQCLENCNLFHYLQKYAIMRGYQLVDHVGSFTTIRNQLLTSYGLSIHCKFLNRDNLELSLNCLSLA
jgi:hypothetical protein